MKALVSCIEEVTGKKATIDAQPEQAGDVPHTFADVAKAQRLLNYNPQTNLKDGVQAFYEWFLKNKELLLHA